MNSEKIVWLGAGVMTTLIGGWDFTLQVLLVLMAIDVLAGIIKAFHGGNFTSRQFREGLFSKSGFILVLILCFQLDTLMDNPEPFIRTICCYFYIAVEGSSIIENLGEMGVPIPSFVSKGLAKLRELSDKGTKADKDTFEK